MCPLCNRLFALTPLAALAAGAVALAGGSFADTSAPNRAVLPAAPTAVAPAPEGLSPVTTTRDWQEVAGSPSDTVFF